MLSMEPTPQEQLNKDVEQILIQAQQPMGAAEATKVEALNPTVAELSLSKPAPGAFEAKAANQAQLAQDVAEVMKDVQGAVLEVKRAEEYKAGQPAEFQKFVENVEPLERRIDYTSKDTHQILSAKDIVSTETPAETMPAINAQPLPSEIAPTLPKAENIEVTHQDSYDHMHSVMSDWMQKLAFLESTHPERLEQISGLKARLSQALEQTKAQLNLEEYGKPGTTFMVDVPSGWYDLESELNALGKDIGQIEPAVVAETEPKTAKIPPAPPAESVQPPQESIQA